MADALAPPAPANPATALPPLDDQAADIEGVKRASAAFRDTCALLRQELAKVMVGQEGVVDLVLIALFADGHVLLEGVPGLGKTLLIRTLGEALSLPFKRIQFTPDLMPADITGTSIVIEDERTGKRDFEFRQGPLFCQLLLADEINRATPKSQAALLEAMQERAVTVAGMTHALARPFFVMATQNPIEQEGTYPLPEAQLDRFLFKITVPYTTQKEMNEILLRTTATAQRHARAVLDGERLRAAQRLARRVIVAPHVQDFAIRLVLATHVGRSEHAAEEQWHGLASASPGVTRRAAQRTPRTHPLSSLHRHVQVGVSPRGAQALISGGKVRALMEGRYAAGFRDIEAVAHAALRHRIIRSFEAEAEGITTDDVIDRLLELVPRA